MLRLWPLRIMCLAYHVCLAPFGIPRRDEQMVHAERKNEVLDFAGVSIKLAQMWKVLKR